LPFDSAVPKQVKQLFKSQFRYVSLLL